MPGLSDSIPIEENTQELTSTHVLVYPKQKEFAKTHNLSMSQILRAGLDAKMKNDESPGGP
jgi:hypothetical protein